MMFTITSRIKHPAPRFHAMFLSPQKETMLAMPLVTHVEILRLSVRILPNLLQSQWHSVVRVGPV